MSQTHDAHEIETSTSNIDFTPLIDDDTEDFAITRISSPEIYSRRRRGPRLWLIGVIVIALVALVGGGVFAYMQFTGPRPVTYTQSAATLGNLAVTVSATGPVQANAVYNMNFGASGQIQSIDVHIGEQVEQGQELATLSSTSLGTRSTRRNRA